MGPETPHCLRSYEASILAASGVIDTAILAISLLGERLALHQVVGIAVMLAGIALVPGRCGLLKRQLPPV